MVGSASFLVWLALAHLVSAAAMASEDSFRDSVAPILEAKCLRCHGGTSTKGDLSLATLADATKGGLSGPAVVPGKPDESWLLDMISGDEPAMPKDGDPLSTEEVAALRRWIEQGAPWPDGLALKERKADAGPWWAIQPLKRPEIPRPKQADRARNPIDAFLLARLESEGLTYRPEADRRTLIRRLTFDLHGLPPTPAEVDAFINDPRPDAYDHLVSRLLASPRYGERWGRHWLDVVHYGDTHGYDKDKRRDHAWPYRDYVIRSLNADKPYSEFIREQLAGDVLRPDDPDAVIATGFIAAGPWDFVGHVELREGTVEKMKTRLVDRDDMLANAMSTFVSLTVHCARCHDHKFDPIPQRDYYRLQAVFAGVDRGDRPTLSPAAIERREKLKRKREYARSYLNMLEPALQGRAAEKLTEYEKEVRSLYLELGQLKDDQPTVPSPSNGYHSAIEPRPDVTKWVQIDLGRTTFIDAIRLHPARPTDFPDTPGFGFPVAFRLELADDDRFQENLWTADSPEGHGPFPGDSPVTWNPQRRARFLRITATKLRERTQDYIFALAELEVFSDGRNVAAGEKVTAHDSIEAGRWSTRFLVDGYNSRAQLPTPEITRRQIHERIAALDYRRRRLKEATEDLPSTREQVQGYRDDLARIERALASLPTPPPSVYAAVPHEPRPIHLLNRGEVEQPGEPVGPGALSCVPGLNPAFDATDDEGARRAALANWIASSENRLTWRSIVNRVWQYHFGHGLVATPNDFGQNGSTPTHPELLDWLAVEFRDGGQSLKALHRLIVTSAAYRQSSDHDPAAARLDGGNALLWRMDRRRLEAEEIRDAVLAVSGQLDNTMGGPGFEVFRFKDDHSPIYDHLDPKAILHPEGHRRCVYRFIVRSVPNPFLECLDGADPNTNTPVRNETITALQALTLLNDPFLIEQAEAFADRLRRDEPDSSRQINLAFHLAFGRAPSDAERAAVSAFASEHGLAAACRLLFNANEFVFVD